MGEVADLARQLNRTLEREGEARALASRQAAELSAKLAAERSVLAAQEKALQAAKMQVLHASPRAAQRALLKGQKSPVEGTKELRKRDKRAL